MKIPKKIAAATLVPAAAAGIAVSGLAIASADQPSGHPQASGHHVQAGQRHAAQQKAKATATPAPKPSEHHKAGKSAEKAQSAALNHAGRHPAAKANHKARAKAHHKAAAKPAPVAAAPSSTSMFTGMSAFERCVAWRESGDNPTASSAGMFGILPSTWASLGYPGTAGTSSVALQKEAFNRLYAMYGTSPWAPYDGC
jgi:hypothetical protein